VSDIRLPRLGRYATDASHYQIMPLGVVAPRSAADARLAREEGVAVTPRGGGTSQGGQTINTSLVIDCSLHLGQLLDVDATARRCAVDPGAAVRHHLASATKSCAIFRGWFECGDTQGNSAQAPKDDHPSCEAERRQRRLRSFDRKLCRSRRPTVRRLVDRCRDGTDR
jgi:hypothetical protein